MTRDTTLIFILSVLILNNILAQDTSEVHSLINSDSSSFNQFGGSIALHNELLIVGARDGFQPNNEGAAYIFKYDNGWKQVAKLTASDTAEDDFFGISVDIYNDLAIVGAFGDDGNDTYSGSAYIFQLVNSETQEWIEVAKLNVTDISDKGLFGSSVAIHKDIAIVGAQGDDDNGEDTGAVYIFERSPDDINTWQEITKITNPESSNYEAFGTDIDVFNEFVVIGAPNNNSIDTRTGAAFLYQRHAGGINNWGYIAKLTPSDGRKDYGFGISVAIYEDRVLVGARSADGIWGKTGAAYSYKRNYGGENTWGEAFKIIASDGNPGDFFGNSIALHNNIAIIGAERVTDFGANSGASYIFKYTNSNESAWEEVIKLYSPNSAYNDLFGSSVATDGENFVVGAPNEDKSGTDNGGVYIYERGMFTSTESFFHSDYSIQLNQNYPNPFNPSTNIQFNLPQSSEVKLTVYDVTGRQISILIDEIKNAGIHSINFDAPTLSSGIYFYRLEVGSFIETKKMLLIK